MTSITPIPALENNYFWVIRPDNQEPFVYLVDPGDAAPVIDYLQKHQLQLNAILITHRHHDHIDGINELLQLWPVPVYGPDSPAIPQITHKLKDGDRLRLHPLEFEVIAVPGHDTACAYDAMPASPDGTDLFLSSGTWSLVGFESDQPVLGPDAMAARISAISGRADRRKHRPTAAANGANGPRKSACNRRE